MNNAIKSTSVLMLAAMIWGFAFVAQRSGMEHVGPFFFNGVRTLLGALTLVALLLVQGAAKRGKAARGIPPAGATGIPPAAENGAPPTAATGASPAAAARAAGKAAGFWNDERKALLWGGFLCGLVLFAGSNFQQIGLVFTTASKAGFITTLYIVLVPIFGIFLKQQT
ncbi:MAG: EamA family transporter, partial [Clostridiales Family XIII bacterium]|nr:EamA family transporter [Clostridiales Family XIII bacterium]